MTIERKYAELITHYCLQPKVGDRVYIQSTLLAEPLVKELYSSLLDAGTLPEINLEFREQSKIYFEHSSEHQLRANSPLRELIFSEFDQYLYIRAPFNLREENQIDPKKRAIRAISTKHINKIYSERTASGDMVRSLCQYPTDASAQEAGMSLSEYQNFVYNACHLYADDPAADWLQIRSDQQRIVDHLNRASTINYKNEHSDITFSVKDRIWINSDGRTNMPSGEVFTGPVEDSVNGVIYFDYPSIYRGVEVRGVTLTVKDGRVEQWEADIGQKVLDEVMKIEGARYFGEVAIGTNYNIQRATKNILFDEKIGGTIHMAVGQSYMQTGGTNRSPIHWDLIADMKKGQITADGERIYENGQFLI